MPLHLRKRGDIWHARGTVRVGRETVDVGEFSTGARSRADALAVAAQEEARIRAEALEGVGGRVRRLTIADCLEAYLSRPGGVPPYDVERVADFNERLGGRTVADADAAWADWLATRGRAMAPSTAARWRTILQAALGAGAARYQFPRPILPPVRQRQVDRAAYLTQLERDRLLAAYNRWAAPVALVLCFAGLRTQEALRLDWRHVDFARGTLFVPGASPGDAHGAARTKSGIGRTVPMHVRVRQELLRLWTARRQPDTGPVFLSHRGEPYSDTRGKGGNPLAKAHATACAKAGIRHFRVHDWRHHWASCLVMTGCDLSTLMRLGGWTTPRMVQRYAAVGVDHMAAAIGRLG